MSAKLETVVFMAEPSNRYLYEFEWSGRPGATPQEAANEYFRGLKTPLSDKKQEALRLKALKLGADRCILDIKAYFPSKRVKDSYTLSNFGPVYSIAAHLAEDGRYLPGPGTEHKMINSESLRNG